MQVADVFTLNVFCKNLESWIPAELPDITLKALDRGVDRPPIFEALFTGAYELASFGEVNIWVEVRRVYLMTTSDQLIELLVAITPRTWVSMSSASWMHSPSKAPHSNTVWLNFSSLCHSSI